jgi:hypothetical protein
MGLNLWKVLSFIRDVLSYLPLPGSNKPKLEYRPVTIQGSACMAGSTLADAHGNAINLLVFGSAHFSAWQKDDTLKTLIPDPANSVVAVFSGPDADAFRAIVGMDKTA